jgi:hypothetical protein
VHPERDEIFVDERRQTGVGIRLVFEPLAGPSGGRRAKVDQERLILIFCGLERLIGVFDPIDRHEFTSRFR